MLKKSIIGLVLLALAMPAFAGDDIETKWEKGTWPVFYKFQPACDKVKVIMNVGYYTKIKDCKKLKITLNQNSINEYQGCTDFEIMSNFDLELGATIKPTEPDGADLGGSWSAWIDGNNFVDASTSYVKRKVCAKGKDLSIVNADPNKELHVATVTIVVRPTAQPSPQ